MHLPAHPSTPASRLVAWTHHSAFLVIVACLLALAAANISLRASWTEVEDGVLWAGRPEGAFAAEIAPGSAADRAGLHPGDLLVAIQGHAVETPDQVLEMLHEARPGARLSYTVLRAGAESLVQVALEPVAQGNRALYFVLAAVAIFTLLVGCSVRIRRPADQATLHFFWLCVAFFGVFAFSFSGRLDRLDWVFYWADVVAMLLLPPLFLHFALVFPERHHPWTESPTGRLLLPLTYGPAALLGFGRALVVARALGEGPAVSAALTTLDRLEMVHLAAGLLAGFLVMWRALRRTTSMTGQRQLRWIVWGTALGALPFVVFYVLPFAAGLDPLPKVELLALPLGVVPLAFASAVVRYRLGDVEVIVKRGVSYAVAISAIAAIYAVILELASELFLGGADRYSTVVAVLATLVVVLLAPVVKNAIQTTLDRAHYRDRYDYRRALVGFARDLNSELDPHRLSHRLVERVRATLALDRMALLVAAPDEAGWDPIHVEGFPAGTALRVHVVSGIGGRLDDGHAVSLEDPFAARRFAAGEVSAWRERGVHYFVPCVSSDRTIAVMAVGGRDGGEPLNSEDLALLAGIAGQVATALENGRLYSELRVKADELNRLREFSENIIASLNDGLFVVGLDGRIVRWNPSLERLYGLARANAVGGRVSDVFDGTFLASLTAAMEAEGGEGTLYRVELASRHAPPRTLLVNAAVAPLRTPDGHVAGTIVIVEDTTARVKLEEQLQISEKMASIGLLAAGVAHEVNTPLTGISSYTQMLLESARPDDPSTPLLEKIERQTFRAAKIVNGLLNLARPAQTEVGRVDLNLVVNDVISLLEHQLRGGRVQVRRELSETPPLVLGIEHKLQQVFLNLILNARDAMPSGGWLSIATRVEDGRALAEVGDTGAGMPPEQLSRIYDPFFTTKPIGQGTGLGLSITYGIVQEHHGTISCESAPGQGTRFVLSLPCAAGECQRSGQAVSSP
jgi:PAS domain S-box-containing protein